jgi:YihY family inner membrane protein
VNPVERLVRGVDRVQQRNRFAGLIFGVVKKFGDDRGPFLSALLAYYGFMSLFPLLLVLTTILGFIGNAKLQSNLIGTTLNEFPVVGQQIGATASHPLKGNGVALAFGLLTLLHGSLGVAQAGQHAMAQVWNVPGVRRPGFLPRLARSLAFFTVLGTGVVVTTALSGLATVSGRALYLRAPVFLAEVGLNVGLYVAVFRVLTPKVIPTRAMVTGAVFGGLGYSVLLTIGTELVQHQLRHAQVLYGQFGFVLGLMAWLYLVAELTLYAAELNVVRSRHEWPRSIVQPPLTGADERVLGDIARQEERRPEQRVGVGFAPDAAGEDAAGTGWPARAADPGPRDGSGEPQE